MKKKIITPKGIIPLLKDIWDQIIVKHSFSTTSSLNKGTYIVDKISYTIEISERWETLDIKYWQGDVNVFWIEESLIQNIDRKEIGIDYSLLNYKINEDVDLWVDYIQTGSSIEELKHLVIIYKDNSNIIKKISKIRIEWLVERKIHPLTGAYMKQNCHNFYFSYEIDWGWFKEYEIKKISKD